MKKRIYLFLSVALGICLLSGCSKPALPKAGNSAGIGTIGEDAPRRYAQDYLRMTKAEIESELGEKDRETDYGGALVYKFKNADLWFWFGGDWQDYSKIPDSAECVFVLASLRDAADFDEGPISRDTLSAALGFAFSTPAFDEHEGLFEYTAEKDGVSCTVSCAEDGTASPDNDYVIYKTKE